MTHPIGRGELVRLALVALFFLAAPTAGDIGGCSQIAEDLDPAKFFDAKQRLDCVRCMECHFDTDTCTRACGEAVNPGFPDGCYPLVHDGEVCLDALEAASCDDYTSYVADQGSTVPTECDFCPALPADGGTSP